MPDAAVAEILAEMGQPEFDMWRHQPAGRVFFAFLADQLANWRENSADMVMHGLFSEREARPARNPHYVGGQMRAFDDLLRITLADIQGFYREASGGEEVDGVRPAEAH